MILGYVNFSRLNVTFSIPTSVIKNQISQYDRDARDISSANEPPP